MQVVTGRESGGAAGGSALPGHHGLGGQGSASSGGTAGLPRGQLRAAKLLEPGQPHSSFQLLWRSKSRLMSTGAKLTVLMLDLT